MISSLHTKDVARVSHRARVELEEIHNLESQYLHLTASGSRLEFLPFVGSLTPVGATVGQCLRCEEEKTKNRPIFLYNPTTTASPYDLQRAIFYPLSIRINNLEEFSICLTQ